MWDLEYNQKIVFERKCCKNEALLVNTISFWWHNEESQSFGNIVAIVVFWKFWVAFSLNINIKIQFCLCNITILIWKLLKPFQYFTRTQNTGFRLYLEIVHGSATHMGCGISGYSEFAFYHSKRSMNYNVSGALKKTNSLYLKTFS